MGVINKKSLIKAFAFFRTPGIAWVDDFIGSPDAPKYGFDPTFW